MIWVSRNVGEIGSTYKEGSTMSLLSEIVSLLTSILQPARPAYTTIVDPCQGRAVVSDGLAFLES